MLYGSFKKWFRSPVLALTVIPCLLLLLILVCNFYSNCPYSVQSNSIRSASQVVKLSQFLLSKCNGRTHLLSSPVADVLLKADEEEAEVFIWHKPGLTKAAWGQLSHPCAGTLHTWAVMVEELIVILGMMSREMVCDLGRATSPQCLLSLVAGCWQWDP